MIKYRFVIQQSPKTSNYHVYFEDSWAATKVLKFLILKEGKKLTHISYFPCFQNSIQITPPEGISQWEMYCVKYVWPSSRDDNNKGNCFFFMDLDGNLILPEYCCRCNKNNPVITQTILDSNMKIVSQEKYCSNCSADYSEILMGASNDG